MLRPLDSSSEKFPRPQLLTTDPEAKELAGGCNLLHPPSRAAVHNQQATASPRHPVPVEVLSAKGLAAGCSLRPSAAAPWAETQNREQAASAHPRPPAAGPSTRASSAGCSLRRSPRARHQLLADSPRQAARRTTTAADAGCGQRRLQALVPAARQLRAVAGCGAGRRCRRPSPVQASTVASRDAGCGGRPSWDLAPAADRSHAARSRGGLRGALPPEHPVARRPHPRRASGQLQHGPRPITRRAHRLAPRRAPRCRRGSRRPSSPFRPAQHPPAPWEAAGAAGSHRRAQDMPAPAATTGGAATTTRPGACEANSPAASSSARP